MELQIIGSDTEGVTDISLENLKNLANQGKILESIRLDPGFPPQTTFIFKDHTAYVASGLSYGYSGEGPHGLHQAIRMFSNSIDGDFHNTAIPLLPQEKSWIWEEGRGFTHR
jgi:hypothetical protein